MDTPYNGHNVHFPLAIASDSSGLSSLLVAKAMIQLTVMSMRPRLRFLVGLMF